MGGHQPGRQSGAEPPREEGRGTLASVLSRQSGARARTAPPRQPTGARAASTRFCQPQGGTRSPRCQGRIGAVLTAPRNRSQWGGDRRRARRAAELQSPRAATRGQKCCGGKRRRANEHRETTRAVAEVGAARGAHSHSWQERVCVTVHPGRLSRRSRPAPLHSPLRPRSASLCIHPEDPELAPLSFTPDIRKPRPRPVPGSHPYIPGSAGRLPELWAAGPGNQL